MFVPVIISVTEMMEEVVTRHPCDRLFGNGLNKHTLSPCMSLSDTKRRNKLSFTF